MAKEGFAMKKALAAILALLMCLSCAGCDSEYPYYDMEIKSAGGMTAMKYIWFEELSALEDYVPIIVQGFVQNDAKRFALIDDPICPVYATQSTLHITKVYKSDLKAGDTVPLIERWYTRKGDDGEEELWTFCGYMPSDPNTEYIFFLGDAGKDFPDAYTIPDYEVSRFPVPNASTDPACVTERESYRYYIPDNYRSIYAEIIEKYF